MTKADVLIIGSGLAGMTAAITSAKNGLSVILIDQQPPLTGQVYHNHQQTYYPRENTLNNDYIYSKKLINEINHHNITHISNGIVWTIEVENEGDIRIFYSKNGYSSAVSGKKIVIATGAIERPMLVPGWTLNGTITANDLKNSLMLPELISNKTVIVGVRPFIYLLASQMIQNHAIPLALIETQNHKNSLQDTQDTRENLHSWTHLIREFSRLEQTLKAKIPHYESSTNVVINGESKTEAVSFQSKGKSYHINCDSVYLHNGFIPNTHAARSINVDHTWSESQQSFFPTLNVWGQSNIKGVFITGDAAGISGAKVAEINSHIVALKITQELGLMSDSQRDKIASPLRSLLKKEISIQTLSNYTSLDPDDSTIICRCKKITAGKIRECAKLGCLDPDLARAFTKVGTGECQGKDCGLAVNTILAQANNLSNDKVGYFRVRPPLVPINLKEIAKMNDNNQSQEE